MSFGSLEAWSYFPGDEVFAVLLGDFAYTVSKATVYALSFSKFCVTRCEGEVWRHNQPVRSCSALRLRPPSVGGSYFLAAKLPVKYPRRLWPNVNLNDLHTLCIRRRTKQPALLAANAPRWFSNQRNLPAAGKMSQTNLFGSVSNPAI